MRYVSDGRISLLPVPQHVFGNRFAVFHLFFFSLAGFNITDEMTEEVTCSVPRINLPRHNTMTLTSPYGTHVFPRVPHYDVSNNSNPTNASNNDVTYFIYDNFVIGPGADNSFFNANEDHMKVTLPHVVQLLYAYFSMETTQTLFVTGWDLKVVGESLFLWNLHVQFYGTSSKASFQYMIRSSFCVAKQIVSYNLRTFRSDALSHPTYSRSAYNIFEMYYIRNTRQCAW